MRNRKILMLIDYYQSDQLIRVFPKRRSNSEAVNCKHRREILLSVWCKVIQLHSDYIRQYEARIRKETCSLLKVLNVDLQLNTLASEPRGRRGDRRPLGL